MLRVLLALVLLPLAAVAVAAPVPKLKASNYFPLTVGNKWVYDQDGEDVSKEVAKVTVDGKKTRVTVSYSAGQGISWDTEYTVTEGVVWYSKNGVSTYDPPQRQVDLDLKPGAKWTSVISSVSGEIVATGEMVAGEEEQVKVPAGTFTAVPVVYTVTEMSGQRLKTPRVYTYWYAEGVGLVKLKYETGEKVLKSFTTGDDARK